MPASSRGLVHVNLVQIFQYRLMQCHSETVCWLLVLSYTTFTYVLRSVDLAQVSTWYPVCL